MPCSTICGGFHPAPAGDFAGSSPRSPRERIVREHRIVEDHRLGLAAQQADFQLVPELGRGPRWADVRSRSSQRSASSRWPRRWWAIARNAQSCGRLSPPRAGCLPPAGGSPRRTGRRGKAAPSVFRYRPFVVSVCAPDGGSASRTGTSGSAVPSGPSTQAQATGSAVIALVVPPKRSSSAAFDLRQPARSPDRQQGEAETHAESRIFGHQPDGLGERRRGPVEMAALDVQAGQGVPDRRVERPGVGRLGIGGLGPVPQAPLLPGVAARRRVDAEEDRVQPRRGSGGGGPPSCSSRRRRSSQAERSSTRTEPRSSSSSPVAASTQAASRGTSSGSGAGASHSRAAYRDHS